MLIRVRFYGDLKEYMKKGWTTIEVPQGSSLRDFILELAKNRSPDLLEKLTKNGKTTRSEIKIMVNGRNIVHLRGLETEIKDRDLISILPIAGGG